MPGSRECEGGEINANSGQFGRTVFASSVVSVDLWTEFPLKPHHFIFSPSSNININLPQIASSFYNNFDRARVGHSIYIGNNGTSTITVRNHLSINIVIINSGESYDFFARVAPGTWNTFISASLGAAITTLNMAAGGVENIITNGTGPFLEIKGFSTGSTGGINLNSAASNLEITTNLDTVYNGGTNTVTMDATNGPIVFQNTGTAITGTLFSVQGSAGFPRFLDISTNYFSGMGATGPFGLNTISIGNGSSFNNGSNSISIGTNTFSGNVNDGIVIGREAVITGAGSVSIGANSNGRGLRCTVVGNSSGGSGSSSFNDIVAFGNNAKTGGNNTVTIGSNSSTGANGAISIGSGSPSGPSASGNNSISIGSLSVASGSGSVSVGHNSRTTGTNSSVLTPSNGITILSADNSMLLSSTSAAKTLNTDYNNQLVAVFEDGVIKSPFADSSGIDFTRGNEHEWYGNSTVTTTGPASSSFATFSIPASRSAMIEVSVVGAQTSGAAGTPGDTWGYSEQRLVRNNGGTVTVWTKKNLIRNDYPGKALVNPLTYATGAGTFTISINTTNSLPTALTTEVIRWVAKMKITYVSW